jgi:hypothetical protein
LIEEEDDEDILKKGITWKSVLKNLFVIGSILLGAYLIYSANTPETQMNIYIGFMLICTSAMLIQVQKPPPEPFRQTLSIIACKLCGLVKVRNYQDGDYVFRKSGSCDECDKAMEIKQIYSVRLKRPTEKTKKEEDMPKLLKKTDSDSVIKN